MALLPFDQLDHAHGGATETVHIVNPMQSQASVPSHLSHLFVQKRLQRITLIHSPRSATPGLPSRPKKEIGILQLRLT